MPHVVRVTMASAIMLILTLPLQAQNNVPRRGGASGVGTGGVVGTTPPAVVRPPFTRPGPLLFHDRSDPSEAQAPEQAPDDDERQTIGAAPPSEAPPENRRTTITRDRIESPQR